MKKLKHIYDPVFRQNYYWVQAKSFKEFTDIVDKELNIGIPPSIKEEKYGVSLCGRVEFLTIKGMHIPIIWVNKLEPSLVVHECWHALYAILCKKGIGLCEESEEIFAYQLEFLVKNILS